MMHDTLGLPLIVSKIFNQQTSQQNTELGIERNGVDVKHLRSTPKLRAMHVLVG